MTLQTVKCGCRIYELRLNRCGKPKCRVCYPPGGAGDGMPGHGPYWYMQVTQGALFRRFYIGKDLDTSKYVNADGQPDWAEYLRTKQARRKVLKALKGVSRPAG